MDVSFANLVAGLAAEGVEPHVLTFVPGLERSRHTTVDGIPVAYLPGTRRLGNLARHARERRALAAALEQLRPDVVHAQDALLYGYVCLKTELDAPVVVSVHGIVREERKYATGLYRRLQIGVVGAALEKYCVQNARFLVAPTRYAEQYFGGEIRGRIWDVGNPISDRFFGIDSEPEPGRILYTGALIRRKRLSDLVDAMPRVLAAVPDARLRVTGGAADSEYATHLHARVGELGLEDRVSFLGRLSFEDLLDEYRRASLLVLPSGEETSPMVIGEAMAASLPVVATRVGGVPFLVDEGVTGHIVDIGDVVALAQRIGGILGDPTRGAAFGAAGRVKADRDFRTAAVAARVRVVYEEARRSID